MHSADCLEPVLADQTRNDKSAANALQTWKALDEELRSEARLDAIRGSLIGGAAGDALDTPVEFISAAAMVSSYGHPVDDYVEFGDSDSTGAVAGNILGVMNGEKAIPEKWRQNLREYSIVSQVADDLHRRFEAGPDGYSTQDWWDLYPGA